MNHHSLLKYEKYKKHPSVVIHLISSSEYERLEMSDMKTIVVGGPEVEVQRVVDEVDEIYGHCYHYLNQENLYKEIRCRVEVV